MTQRIKLSVGEAIIRFLDNQYVLFDGKEEKFVEAVSTIFGHGCVLGIGEALAMADHSLKVYQGKNEQGMAHTAIAFAKQHNRRKIIPCISSIGPGSANMVTAAATATVNNIPLLLFLGDTFATRRPDPVLQQVEQSYDLGITTNDAFRPVVKYFDRVNRPEVLESVLINAIRVLTDISGTGSVAIALPQDVQGEVYDFPTRMFQKRVTRITRPIATAEELYDGAEEIKKAKYPLVIVGGGVRYSESGKVVAEFCEKFNIPFAETQAGKSAIKGSHPYNLGGIGVTGNAAANAISSKSDLIIGLGTRFSDFTTSSKSLFSKAKVVTINASSFHGDKLYATKMVGDIKATLSALIPLLSSYKSAYKDEIISAKKDWQSEMERLGAIKYSDKLVPEVKIMTEGTLQDFNRASGTVLTQTTALTIVRELIPNDAIVVAASGSLPGCMQRMWTTDSLYSYNMEYGYSCMGYEIAGALGSKLAAPDKEVYSLVGDGSYLMLHSEMVTAVQEGKKINILLFDNGGFGCINNLQMSKGIDSLATEFRYEAKAKEEFVPIDFAMNAKSYGFKTYTARSEEELKSALTASLKDTDPVLIDIKVLPKTMTDGYIGGWWQVGVTNAPRNKGQQQALQDQKDNIKNN